MKIIKRNGTKQDFDKSKIYNAILGAFNDLSNGNFNDFTIINNLTEDVIKQLNKRKNYTVEEIQDIVELTLMKNNYYEQAKAYIEYRQVHKLARNKYQEMLDIIENKIKANNVQNSNANVDEYSFGGRVGEMSEAILKQFALDNLVSETTKNNHINNEIYIHDLGHYALGDHNCLSIPFDDLLEKGFTTRQVDIRPAGSVSTAMQLIAVIFQLQSLQQFGGVAATHLDWTMVPYVRKSFAKHYKDGLKYILGKEDIDYEINFMLDNSKDYSIEDEEYKAYSEKVYNYALDMLRKEVHQSIEALYHNLNSLQSRSGNQLPFTSINYGTCTLKEGRMIIEELLKVSIEGLGKYYRTSIFPCGIFQCMKGVNRKLGDPNYDLFRLALESTSKRIYPNYVNVDWSVNVGYDRNDPRTYTATMGALAGHEHLYVKIGNEEPIDLSIKDLFDYCQSGDLDNYRTAQIYFNKEPLNEKVLGKEFQEKSGLPNLPGVYSITYLPEDVTYIGSSSSISRRCAEHKCSIGKTGGIDAGLFFGDTDTSHYKFEVLELSEDYKELEDKYIQNHANINPRGTAKKYYKLITQKYKQRIYEKPEFKFDLTKEQQLIELSEFDIKVLDRDNRWVKIKHIFKNDKLNSPQMMHIYYRECGKEYCLSCTEDHPLWTGSKFTRADQLKVGDSLFRADGLELPITDICWHWEAVDSYDIGTETGSFIGSDIIMHNCRTYNGFDINADPGVNPQTKDGRGNICPTTIIMPTLAMEADREVEKFITLLDQKIHEAKDSLIERYEYICSQSPKAASFMYNNNVMLGYKPEEGIRSALKHGTLAIGQLGLAETLQLLIGKDHTTEEGMKLAKRIEQLFKDRCKEFKEQYKLNFGNYYTPAESLCFTAMKKFQDKYGIIEKVSDKKYFTNSIHVPVYDKINAFDKIDIESQLTNYSSAGCITYVELDSSCMNNIEAIEKLVNYAMDKDIPYFALNTKLDMCENCGYQAEINDKCPQCRSESISRLRRVTGYLTGSYKEAFNEGKQQETEMRTEHTGVEIE